MTRKHFLRPIDLRPALFVCLALFLFCPNLYADKETTHSHDYVQIDTEYTFALSNPGPGVNPTLLEMWRSDADPDSPDARVTASMIETTDPKSNHAVTALVARLKLEAGPNVHVLYADFSDEKNPQTFAEAAELFEKNPELRPLPEADRLAMKKAIDEYRYQGNKAVRTHNTKITLIKIAVNGALYFVAAKMSFDLPIFADSLIALWMSSVFAFNQYYLGIENWLVFSIPDWTFRGMDKVQDATLKLFGIEEMWSKLGLKIPFGDFAVDLGSRNLGKYSFLKTIPKKLFSAALTLPIIISTYGICDWGINAIHRLYEPLIYGSFDLNHITIATLASYMSIMLATETDFGGEGIPHLAIANFGQRKNIPLAERIKWINSRSMLLSVAITALAVGSDLLHVSWIKHIADPVKVVGIGYYILSNFVPTLGGKKRLQEGLEGGRRIAVNVEALEGEADEGRESHAPAESRRETLAVSGERRLHCLMLLQKFTQ